MFTGNENQSITLAVASTMTKAYRDANPGQILGMYFGKSILQSILNQSGCVGIRTYYAIDSTGAKEQVLVGVTADGNDIYDGVLGDRCLRNPPYNSATNPLNS